MNNHEFALDSMRIWLIDTPGFNDTKRTEAQVLQDIAVWLEQTYKRNVCLSGLIYLHRISDRKMEGSAVRNLHMFQKLCGDKSLKNVVLVTTQWDGISEEVGGARETELSDSDDFWKGMIAKGAQRARFDGSRQSGLAIVRSLLDRGTTVLQLQDEIVNQGLSVFESSAGMAVEEQLNELKKVHREEMRLAQEKLQEAVEQRDLEMRTIMEEEVQRVKEEMKKVQEDQERVNETREAKWKKEQAEREARIDELARKANRNIIEVVVEGIEKFFDEF